MAGVDDKFVDDDKVIDSVLDNEDEQELSNTFQFKPETASTPRGVEQYEMQAMHQEQSGLPDTSYAEMPLLGDFLNPEEKKSRVDRAITFIKDSFPKADLKKLGPIGFSKKGQQADIVSFGPKLKVARLRFSKKITAGF